MKSPFTGKDMKKVYEPRTWNFRGEMYEYMHTAWVCEDTGEQFTDDESDDAGFVQVTNQYREKYGIPYRDEIVAVREKYGISAAKMSLILGLGANQYRLYEQGEVPSVSNGRMIRSVMNPSVMLGMVESSRNEMSPQEYEKVMSKVSAALADDEAHTEERYETLRVFPVVRGKANGYARLSLKRLKEILLYILERCENVWITKMNKLLFYIDFVSYRDLGVAMSGLPYIAIDFGPVPEGWEKVYSEFSEVKQVLLQTGDFSGIMLTSDRKAEANIFTEKELAIMDMVCGNMGKLTSRELSSISHEEKAWMAHHLHHDIIPFDDAFALKAL